MRTRAPALTLVTLTAIAVLVLGAGVSLARRTETTRHDRDHEPLRQFANALTQEVQRLERRHEEHLLRIVQRANPQDDIATRGLCANIVGVKRYSFLQTSEVAQKDTHIDASLGGAPNIPQPTFRPSEPTGLGRRILLNESSILRGDESTGWFSEPNSPQYFWKRITDNTAAVLSIDPTEVRSAMDRSLLKWLPGAFASVRLAGGPDRLLGLNEQLLAQTEAAPQDAARPDFLLPVFGRFGTWQLVSWDRYETRGSYHAPTLAISGSLAVLLILLGIIISRQQHRAFALAAQRVSFVNRVSHELRAPVTNILLNLDLAAEDEQISSEGAKRLGLAREEASRLGRMIENVLTFSRGEAGKLTLHPRACAPDQVIERSIVQFREGFARRQIVVRHEGHAAGACRLDADALAQILTNLLSNVEKYAPNSECAIQSQLDDGRLVVTVSDNGPGIPSAAVERVFQRFERLDSRITEGVTGTGLGLFIARELAECMGGSLRLIPSATGAWFELSVPAPPSEAKIAT